jgi:hypothetical protein
MRKAATMALKIVISVAIYVYILSKVKIGTAGIVHFSGHIALFRGADGKRVQVVCFASAASDAGLIHQNRWTLFPGNV